jgi:hypothetical protein
VLSEKVGWRPVHSGHDLRPVCISHCTQAMHGTPSLYISLHQGHDTRQFVYCYSLWGLVSGLYCVQ